jgi:hypothetical protein
VHKITLLSLSDINLGHFGKTPVKYLLNVDKLNGAFQGKVIERWELEQQYANKLPTKRYGR